MAITHLAGAFAALLTAFVGVRLASLWTSPPQEGRCVTIDGLRGYLAFGVFLHHASVFYYHLQDGTWMPPPSNVLVNLGQASVALFFMITSFLFYGMLRRSSGGTVDWLRLYCSRVTRLTPLYLFAMALLLLIVGTETGWQLRQPVGELALNIVRWLGFTALGMPDINELYRTYIITSGVTWSLPYEWAFYLTLPLIALALRIRPPLVYLLASLVAVAGVVVYAVIKQPGAQHLLAFVGGALAVHLSAIPAVRHFAARPLGSVVTLALIVAAYAGYDSAYHTSCIVLLTAVFTLIAAGCDLFGLLTARLSRVFGEFAYSIYLLHGIVLYSTMELLLRGSHDALRSPLAYWGAIAVLAPVLVIGCSLTYRWIEAPMMRRTAGLVRLVRRPRPVLDERYAA